VKRFARAVVTVAAFCWGGAWAAAGPPAPGAIAAPQDKPYPGFLTLDIDARDVQRRIVHVAEHIEDVGGDLVLLYPRWLPGNHSTTGPVTRLAGLRISAGETPLSWHRDALDMNAFHVRVPAGAKAVDVQFDYLSPTSEKVDPLEISGDVLTLDWSSVVLYPAGFFARQIPVQASVRVPAGWQLATALEAAGPADGRTAFRRVSLETLVDSPVFAGRHAARLDLDPGAAVPVMLNLFADRPEQLAIKPAQLDLYRALVQQAVRLYGSRHYAHYDFLYALTDQLAEKGLEHHESSENISAPDTLSDWDKSPQDRDLLAHEFTHSWNGKFRRPADLWTPNYNVPMRDSLLWVYEGQTEYWGFVLAARAGLLTKPQFLDALAVIAARYELQAGRQWRPLQDTTNDPILNHHRPVPWADWQRYKDYYDEGLLVWLDADTLIRERSGGQRSLDDFARSFFGVNDGSTEVVTYTFEDVVRALDAVEPYDWAAFLRQRLDAAGAPAPLEGLRRGGYHLVYTDKPGDFQRDADAKGKQNNLMHSLGMVIDEKDGAVRAVAWNGPAFKAGITESAQVLAVNGIAYDAEVLADAIRAASQSHAPIALITRTGSRFHIAHIEYSGGLRYPHLERDPGVPARLDQILAARAH